MLCELRVKNTQLLTFKLLIVSNLMPYNLDKSLEINMLLDIYQYISNHDSQGQNSKINRYLFVYLRFI